MSVTDDLTAVIAVLAEACADYESRHPRINRPRELQPAKGEQIRMAATARMVADAARMRPVADYLHRLMAAKDPAGAGRLLDVRRTQGEWRDLALLLAADAAAMEAQRAA